MKHIPTTTKFLVLRNAPITDEGVKNLRHLTSLERLNLGGTKVTDVALDELAILPRLQWINVADTIVTDVAIERLRERCPIVQVVN